MALSITVLLFVKDVNKDKKYYKDTVYKYVVSLKDSIEVVISQDESQESNNLSYLSLVSRSERLEKFIYNSGQYLGFEYQPRLLAKLTYEFEGIVKDGKIDEDEIQRLKLIKMGFVELVNKISIEDGKDVDYKYSIDDLHSEIEFFIYKSY